MLRLVRRLERMGQIFRKLAFIMRKLEAYLHLDCNFFFQNSDRDSTSKFGDQMALCMLPMRKNHFTYSKNMPLVLKQTCQ